MAHPKLTTHCKRGHEFTDQNTYVTPSGNRQCRTCSNASASQYRQRHPERYIAQQVASNERRKEDGRLREAQYKAGVRRRVLNRDAIDTAKNVPCMDCGESYPPFVMDFDHRDPAKKEFNVGRGLSRSMPTLMAEIEKCDVVCSNCHRIRTHS